MSNAALENLKEIALPENISYFPQTFAWYVLFGVILIAIILFVFRKYKMYKKNEYRRIALAELTKINNEKNYYQIPELIKRVGLVFSDRNKIASINSRDWLKFLNASYLGDGFSGTAGNLLIDLSYSSPSQLEHYSDKDYSTLISVVTEWIKRHND